MNKQNTGLEPSESFNALFDLLRYGEEVECPAFEEDSLLESAVIEVSDQVQVKRSMAMLTALGAISSACQGLIDIELPTGKRVPSSLMLLIMAESGERKTSLEGQFFSALRKTESQLQEDFLKELEGYHSELEVWSLMNTSIKQELNKAQKAYLRKPNLANQQHVDQLKQEFEKHKNAEPRKPKQPKFIYEDVTPSALLRGMQNHNRNACLVSSEGNNVFRGHIISDLSTLNGFWDGSDIPVDRTSSESFILRDARLTMMIMAQKVVIDEFVRKRGGEATGLGFWARFLVIKPMPMAGKRKFQNNSDCPHLQNFKHRLSICLDKLSGLENENYEKNIIKFTPSAISLWKDLSGKIESEMGGGGIYEFYPEHASKLMDNVSRIAGLIHYFESFDDSGNNGDYKIDYKTLKFSYELALYCSNHYLKTLAGTPEVVSDADVLVKQIFQYGYSSGTIEKDYVFKNEKYNDLRRGRRVRFNRTDVTRSGVSALRDRSRFERAMFFLIRLGHVSKENKDGYKPYIFSETIGPEVGRDGPKIRNGQVVEVKRLPRYEYQVYFNPEENNRIEYERRYGLRYYILVDKYDK
jgi:hypothetical protein